MANAPTLPDNLLSRASRIYVDARTFENDKKEQIQYKRLVIEFLVKNEPFTIECKVDKKDLAIIALSDVIDGDIA